MAFGDADDFIEFVAPTMVSSPCVLVCTLDAATGWCQGCGRSGEEIARWTAIGEPARLALMATLPARMAALARGQRRG